MEHIKQAKNQHSKAGEGLLPSNHQVRCGSKYGVPNPRGSQASAQWAAFLHFEWEMARRHTEPWPEEFDQTNMSQEIQGAYVLEYA